MKLKKQIQIIFNNDTVNQNRVDRVEKIADDYAIGFAEWSINYRYHPTHKVWIRMDKMANEKYSSKELLEIYKQTL
jgi:hypothetical protein